MPEGNKTEKATPKKRKDERKKGNIFLSKDAVAVATLFAAVLIIQATAGMIVDQLDRYFSLCLHYAGSMPVGQTMVVLDELVREGIITLAMTVGPLIAAVVVTAVGVTFFQTKLLFSTDSIKPKFNRISPLEGFKRLFSLKSVVEAMKGSLKIALLLIIMYNYLLGVIGALTDYLYVDISAACSHLFDESMAMVLQVAGVFLVLAGFDFFYQWWDYERQMRMTKQEIKEEYKQMEGDPQIKGKIKELQRKMAQSRMMQKVPQADVIIRNPTHVAVALRYRPEQDDAPIILAKGLDEVALRIVKVAEEHDITVVENVPLARTLYTEGELDRQIPGELFGAVADVLAYLYRIGKKKL